jgi:hypothetical protein
MLAIQFVDLLEHTRCSRIITSLTWDVKTDSKIFGTHVWLLIFYSNTKYPNMNYSYFYDFLGVVLWAHVREACFIWKKLVVGPRVSISNKNKKITAARPPDPTPNKGDAGSLTIIYYDTGPLVSVSRTRARAAQNFPRILTKIPKEFQLLHKAVKGMPVVSLNTVTRAIHIWLLARYIHNARILPTAAAPRPALLRRSLPAHLRRSLPTRLRRPLPSHLRRSLPAAALLFSSRTAP